MMARALLLLLLQAAVAFARAPHVPDSCRADDALARQLESLVAELGLDGDFDVGEDGREQISLAVIDLSAAPPRFAGVNADNFIYPASVYKMYVGAEILRQISQGRYALASPYVVRAPNAVDRSREIGYDPRPLLQEGDTVSIGYLLDLMITRSDNSAANCLIDLASRDRINALVRENGWQGSEVTRKFLSRKYEDPGYEKIRGTETCALHAADFMYRVEAGRLVNPWVSRQMKTFLGRQLDTAKLAPGLPRLAMFYHKTGWFSYWTNDAGIVDDGSTRYVIACFLPIPEEQALARMKELSRRVFLLLNAQPRDGGMDRSGR